MTAAQADLLALIATQADTSAARLADFAERPRPSVRRDLRHLRRVGAVLAVTVRGQSLRTFEREERAAPGAMYLVNVFGFVMLDAIFNGEG